MEERHPGCTSEDVANSWSEWIAHLHLISSHPVSRRLSPKDLPIVSQQLHGFADASSQAYGAVIYLRSVYQDTPVSTVLEQTLLETNVFNSAGDLAIQDRTMEESVHAKILDDGIFKSEDVTKSNLVSIIPVVV